MEEKNVTTVEPPKQEIETKKEPQPPMATEKKPNDFQQYIESILATAGTIQLTETQKSILYADVDPANIEIRPDGLIYLPWMEYVTRLREAFGLEWALIPQGMPKLQGGKTDNPMIYWPFYLVIQGKLAGFAIGEQAYQPSNAKMTYGDAVEGAKSNALMRLCKGCGMSLELWQPTFIKKWIKEHAEEYYDDKKKKNLWRKKDAPAQQTPEDLDQAENYEFLRVMRDEKKRLGDAIYYGVLGDCGYKHSNKIIKREDQVEVYQILKALNPKKEASNE